MIRIVLILAVAVACGVSSAEEPPPLPPLPPLPQDDGQATARPERKPAKADEATPGDDETKAQELLDRAKRMHAVPEAPHAVVVALCRSILRKYPRTEAAREAQALLAKIETAARETARLQLIELRLKTKVRPYLIAGQWADAVRIVEADSDYQANKGKLKALNEALAYWREKASSPKPALLEGTYRLNGNGHPGRMKITVDGGTVRIHIRYEIAKTKEWETMTNVRYSSASRQLSFTRPWTGNPTFQQYQGKLVGSAISGTFTDNNSPGKQFKWTALKERSAEP